MDRTVHRLTRGRVLLSARMLPGLVLTVPGARSGQPRVTPLACMPEYGDDGGGERGGGSPLPAPERGPAEKVPPARI
ncbi:nitroreductase/quinone reductase family protein [Streptomyces sp. sk2.1]|uniref:nitroreductase/quinone reductase family protein n=1 Tax=Streptomyces sp. sk2.1 TaxID=2478959 RepID=UPI0037DD41E4